MTLHTTDTTEERDRLRAEAIRRASSYLFAAGFSVVPISEMATWWLVGNVVTATILSNVILTIAVVAVLIGYPRFERASKKLAPFRHGYSVEVPGMRGPVQKIYEVKYDLERFATEQFAAYHELHRWGLIYLTGLFTVLGYLVWFAFRDFLWR